MHRCLRLSFLHIFLCLVTVVCGFGTGPPIDSFPAPGPISVGEETLTRNELVCQQLYTGHFGDQFSEVGQYPISQQGNGGYLIKSELVDKDADGSYVEGTTYNLTLIGLDSYKGFLIQARDQETGYVIGDFTVEDSDKAQVLRCPGNSNGTVSHKNPSQVTVQNFTWTVPVGSGGSGKVSFMYTVVKSKNLYWVGLNAHENKELYFNDENLCPPYYDAADTTYRLNATSPRMCTGVQCDYYIAIRTNPMNENYLDFLLEGNATGWLAIGFSDTANMVAADVIGCVINPHNYTVAVVDSYNLADSHDNEPDKDNNVCPHSTSYVDGRITCRFSRLIVTEDESRDFPLNVPYYLLYGQGEEMSEDGRELTYHSGFIPPVSPKKTNPAASNGTVGVNRLRQSLTRTHGVFMIMAWPMLAFTAIFFAAWMKPALPNGQWFQAHRFFMIASVFVGVVGFILIFVANKDNETPGLVSFQNKPSSVVHFLFGIILMALHLINPILAVLRCGPKSPNRWKFNLVHGAIIGITAQVLATINAGIGIAIFARKYNNFEHFDVFWVYLFFVIFLLFFTLGLYALFSFIAHRSKSAKDQIKLPPSLVKPLFKQRALKQRSSLEGPLSSVREPSMGEPSGFENLEEVKDDKYRRPTSKDAHLRWLALFIYLLVMLPLMLAIIGLIVA